MKVNLGVLLTQAKIQGAIGILDSVITGMGNNDDIEVGQVFNTIAQLGVKMCIDEEKIVKDNKLNDYDYGKIDVELDDQFMIQSFEDIVKGYEEASEDEIIKSIINDITSNVDLEEEE